MPPPPSRPKTQLQKLLYEHFSQGGEVASPEEGWRLTSPPTPNSGYSVGWIQLDLSRAKPGESDAVMAVLARDPDLANDIDAIEGILKKKDADLTASDKSVIKQYGDLINQALASPEGKRTLDQIGFERVEEIESDIEHLKSIAAPEAKPFLESQEGQLLLGDYINQFGGPTVLEDFVQGKEVTLNDGKNKIKLDGPLTVEKWQEYVGKTRFGESHPTIIDSRFDNVKDTLGRHRLLPDAPRVRPRSRVPVPPPGQRSGLEGGQGKAAARRLRGGPRRLARRAPVPRRARAQGRRCGGGGSLEAREPVDQRGDGRPHGRSRLLADRHAPGPALARQGAGLTRPLLRDRPGAGG